MVADLAYALAANIMTVHSERAHDSSTLNHHRTWYAILTRILCFYPSNSGSLPLFFLPSSTFPIKAARHHPSLLLFPLSMDKNVITEKQNIVLSRPPSSHQHQQQHRVMEETHQYLSLGYAPCCPPSSASTSTSALPSPASELAEFDLSSTRNGGSSRASPDTSIDGDGGDDAVLPLSSIILGGGVFVSLSNYWEDRTATIEEARACALWSSCHYFPFIGTVIS